MEKDQIQFLNVDMLQPNPFQPRNKIKSEDLEELANSIKEYGVLEPLVVAHTPAGYQIIAGERRWRASKLANLHEVPAIIKKTTPRGMLEMAIVENVQRIDLSPLERARSFQQLMRDFNYAVSDIANRVGKSQSFVSNSLKLLSLPDAVKDALSNDIITEGHARAISGIPDGRSMIEALRKVIDEHASVRRAEEIARQFKAQLNGGTPVKKNKKITQVTDPKIAAWQEKLQSYLDSKSIIKLHRSQTNTRITITLKGDYEKTQRDLEKIIELTEN